ncbi:MAG: phenylalanine--tRNA ligase subunit alpha [Pseudomonadota bacterium]
MADLNYKLIFNKIQQLNTINDLNQYKAKYFGKNGIISSQYQQLKQLSGENKAKLGQQLNEARNKLDLMLNQQKSFIEHKLINDQLALEQIDITLPPKTITPGGIHPTSFTAASFIRILSTYGFELVDGPSLETNHNNFDALNIGPLHPARQMHDTFYLNDATALGADVLRTHTSSVQIRAMQQLKPPFRLMSLGRVYRDDSDQTHTPMFHQLEGIVAGNDVTMAHMKYLIAQLMQQFFGVDEVPLRLRPSYFPFTEPSAEIDINYQKHQQSIKIGRGDHWLEVMGCGMINPVVLNNVGIDSTEYRGFAFGLGLDRMAMLKYGINNLPQFFAGDLRWLKFYNFAGEHLPI